MCGGRGYNDHARVFEVLDSIGPSVVIHGGAPGADAIAGKWAKSRGAECEVFPADWLRYGRSAGPIRNRKMIMDGKPDLVVALPGGRGTQNMLAVARKVGCRILVIPEQAIDGQVGD